MPNLAAIATLAAHLLEGRQNGCIPRIAIFCAALAALAGVIDGGWDAYAHADGGASARSQAATHAPDDGGATAQARAQQILRALSDHDSNNWVRYWQARAACQAAAHDAPAAPIDLVLLTLTDPLCAQLDARIGVNPADSTRRAATSRTEGLLIGEPAAAAGYTLFSVRDTRNVYLIDPLGRVAHEWHLAAALPGRSVTHAKLLDNGNLMIMTNVARALMEVGPRGNILWQYNDGIYLHHDFLKMPGGNVLLLVRGTKTRAQAIAAGANPEFIHESGFGYDYLVEVRPADASGGEVVWRWSSWDHLVQDFDPAKPNYGAIAEHPELIDINFLLESMSEHRRHRPYDWLHTNSIDYNPELDQIMLSPRHFSELWIIDHSATTEDARGHTGGNGGMGGDLLYRYGNPRAYDRGDADDQRLFWQHQTHWIPPGLPGAGNILVFNNGLEFPGDERSYSSVDEIVPPVDGYRYSRADDTAYPPDRLEWTYAAETRSDFYAPIMSGAQRLPNGNTLIADGTAGTIFQVTPDGKTVWKYIVPRHYHISLWQETGAPPQPTYGTPDNHNPPDGAKNEVYRAYLYPPNHPGLSALDLALDAYIESDPDLLDWARATALAGDFGQPLADARFDIYLNENILFYFKQPCAEEDTQARFFLHIFPADARDLSVRRQELGFNNGDFGFNGRGKISGDRCAVIRRLPDYAIELIRTGQFTDDAGQLWIADINLNE